MNTDLKIFTKSRGKNLVDEFCKTVHFVTNMKKIFV